MYKTILVPLDLSKRAEAILPHVEELALSGRAIVILLHVVDTGVRDYSSYAYQPHPDDVVVHQRTSAAEAYLGGVRARFSQKGIPVQTRIAYGPVVDGVMQAARETGADLIAMTSHGRGGLARVVYGSVAEGVLRRADRPLLLVRSLQNAPGGLPDDLREKEVSHGPQSP